MSRHLKYKNKKYTSYPWVTKACANKVRVVNGFVTQVLACGVVLCGPRRSWCPGVACPGKFFLLSTLACAIFLDGDVHTNWGYKYRSNWPLAPRVETLMIACTMVRKLVCYPSRLRWCSRNTSEAAWEFARIVALAPTPTNSSWKRIERTSTNTQEHSFGFSFAFFIYLHVRTPPFRWTFYPVGLGFLACTARIGVSKLDSKVKIRKPRWSKLFTI